MKARKENYQSTETPTGSRVSLHTMITGNELCYHVSKFAANDYTCLYIGTSEALATAIYNEYREEYAFD